MSSPSLWQRLRSALRLALLALLVSGGASAAQEPDGSAVHPEAREAIERLWSPYCPGLMLEVCPSPGGQMLRDSIESMARSGLEADSIIELMLAEYGEEYRAVPRLEGVGGLAWYVPPLAFLAGLAVIALFLAHRLARREPREEAPPPTEADEDRLRRAMAELDEEERPDF